ncbi:hypothetical protein ACE193_10420 [Bernardetia sp. OM2101]|uniref:hypothetical protein n=1 Tax=Bernardetia sp. OM2101 TaxID=3344876 RepID=UPI0035CFA267
MAKNSTLADLDAFLKEQETSKNNTKKAESSYTKEEFVNQNPHQIVETEILAQEDKTAKKEDKKPKIDTTVEIKTSVKKEASKHMNNLVPNTKEEDSTMMQWAKAIDETVKGSEMLRSVPLLSDITKSGTEQLKATEKFLETSQNIWKKFWD